MATIDPSTPAPLRLPAILQNPTNTSFKQVEAYNAQQREKLQARREAKNVPRVESKLNGKGKRVIRRLDNAQFTSNPHIQPPLKSDYYPSVPLQPRSNSSQPLFPSGSISRKENIPSVVIPDKNPNSNDSINGNFNLSLKGTRALLRKRGGKRVEGLIGKIENELRGWLGGDFNVTQDGDFGGSWKVIDDTLIDPPPSSASESQTSTSFGSISQPNHIQSNRRLPPQHQILGLLPSLPKIGKQYKAILEISRSPVHLSWFIVDPFERLVVHLLARYYELHSWSESYQTISGESTRITHIIIPNIVKPRISAIDSNNLITPETSELSSQSGPESDLTISSSSSEESDSDTATERGDDEEIGYSLEQEGDITITSLPEDISTLQISEGEQIPLQRSISNISNNSSAYASSEGGNSDYSLLNDSLFLPAKSKETNHQEIEDWSDFGEDLGDLPKPPITTKINIPTFGNSNGKPGAGFGRKTWEDKPTFFEYLYGV